MNRNLDQYLSRLYIGNVEHINRSLTSWRSGIEYEVGFWSKWFETKGLEWPEDYSNRILARPLEPFIENLVPDDKTQDHLILDVGSGPIIKMGTVPQAKNVRVIATDPLADIYAEIRDKNGIVPAVVTELSFAEDLSARFDEETFDLVTCTNALDHSIEPVWGIIEMMIVLKKAGHILLGHRRNEAEFEGYTGFHQWNFDAIDNQFIIWNANERYSVNSILEGFADVTVELIGDGINVRIQKHQNFQFNMTSHHRQLRASLLAAMVRGLSEAN